ncbi:MAG: hypothetical protein QOF70_5154, partial [Acetobacteraceae bacterium]|nr:hypothetical protein [Acetobacteraceae bacterium]
MQRRVRARATGDRSHYEIRTIIVTAVRRKENNQSDTELHGVRSRVEEGRGIAYATRFPSPLIKPDVRISRIRLSDWLHGG